MKALCYKNNGFSLRDVQRPSRPPGESLIRIKAAGVCATDIEIGRGYMDFTGVPGHEFVGTVEASDTSGLEGKRVVGEINCTCGRCEFCIGGSARHCRERTVLGILARDGCFAEYVILPDRNLHILPDAMTDFQGVMVEPTAAAYRVVEQLGTVSGVKIAVVGDGRLGILIAQALAAEGASVFMIGRHPERRQLLDESGTEFCLSGSAEEASLSATFAVAVECTGSPEGPAAALELLQPLGRLVLKSTISRPLRLPSERLVVDEINVIGSRCGPFPEAIDAIHRGKIRVDGMLDETFPLDRAPEAIDHAAKPGALKVLITMA